MTSPIGLAIGADFAPDSCYRMRIGPRVSASGITRFSLLQLVLDSSAVNSWRRWVGSLCRGALSRRHRLTFQISCLEIAGRFGRDLKFFPGCWWLTSSDTSITDE